MDNLPRPGEVLRVDSRCSHGDPGKTTLRLVQWNIERGYQLPKIIQQLKELDADIVCLQEVDIGCERTGRVDTGAVIAHALHYEYLFVCEFEELLSPVRHASLQGGGVHGNAILSRYDITSWTLVEHSHHPVDWNDPTHPRCQKEPRKGRRLTLAADIATPLGSLRVYTAHLEVFCGMLDRMRQFADVLIDAKQAAQQWQQQQQQQLKQPSGQRQGQLQAQQELEQQQGPGDSTSAVANAGEQGAAAPVANKPDSSSRSSSSQKSRAVQPVGPLQAIVGDLNTMAHGIARLSPDYCCDAMRWRSLGWSEAAYWQRHVLSYYMPPVAAAGGSPDMEQLRPYLSPQLLQQGLSEEECAALLNPGFVDPFDVDADETLDNPKYKLLGVSLMKGKLDWVLLRGLQVVGKGIGNHDYAASDHKWLMVDVRVAGPGR